MAEDTIMFTMFRDHTLDVFLVVPTSQLEIFHSVMKKQGSEVERLIEDNDVDFLEAVGPILI